MNRVACKKSVCLQKKCLTEKKAFSCKKNYLPAIFFVTAILSKADVQAQQALI
jgi:hypothetical protein